jgi:hypothetical protein
LHKKLVEKAPPAALQTKPPRFSVHEYASARRFACALHLALFEQVSNI